MAQAIFAVTHSYTPVFNTPDLARCFGGGDGASLLLSSQGLMHEVETVLFPGTKLQLIEQVAHSSVWRITTEEYPYEEAQFIDERFVARCPEEPASRMITLPPAATILQTMRDALGARYMWGSTCLEGIDSLPTFYPSKVALQFLPSLIQDTWKLKGVDCSGLLRRATQGWTPHRTSSLVDLGKPVAIEGLSAEEIAGQLQPLDLIVWVGHVVIAEDSNTTIESTPQEGVIRLNACERIQEIMGKKRKRPVNSWASTTGERFVVRRWYPESVMV